MKRRLYHYLCLARFNRPAGTLLLLWPTLWGLWAAAPGAPDGRYLGIFIAGVVVTRAFGCVINDMADYRLDRAVTRTKSRPLAANKISLYEAAAIAGFFLLLAFALWLQLPVIARWWSAAALLIAVMYPFCKRYLAAPQAVLGAAFGCGILIADAAVNRASPSATAWLLFTANFFWVIAYDTIYAMADRDDDRAYGKIGSTALLFGRRDVIIVSLLYVFCIVWLSLIGIINDYGVAYQVALIAATVCVFRFWQKYKTRHPQACMAAFRANHWFGLFVFSGIVAAEYSPVT